MGQGYSTGAGFAQPVTCTSAWHETQEPAASANMRWSCAEYGIAAGDDLRVIDSGAVPPDDLASLCADGPHEREAGFAGTALTDA